MRVTRKVRKVVKNIAIGAQTLSHMTHILHFGSEGCALCDVSVRETVAKLAKNRLFASFLSQDCNKTRSEIAEFFEQKNDETVFFFSNFRYEFFEILLSLGNHFPEVSASNVRFIRVVKFGNTHDHPRYRCVLRHGGHGGHGGHHNKSSLDLNILSF